MSKWFGGSRGHSSGRRPARPSGRPRSQRASLERNPLIGLELPEVKQQQQPDDQQAPPRRKKRIARKIIGLTVPQFVLVTLGLLLFLGLFFGVNWYYDRKQAPAAQAAAVKKAPAGKPPPAPAPAPRLAVYQATSPAEAVRAMVKASLSGDEETAYGQWGITPQDIGCFKAGQELTVAEMVTIAGQRGKGAAVEGMQFETREQSGNTAKVVQLRDGMIQQVYSLRRQGPYWKIFNVSIP
ncbi:MAG: hypothetical protein ABFE08_07205 [Armatimonadia bacterium]